MNRYRTHSHPCLLDHLGQQDTQLRVLFPIIRLLPSISSVRGQNDFFRTKRLNIYSIMVPRFVLIHSLAHLGLIINFSKESQSKLWHLNRIPSWLLLPHHRPYHCQVFRNGRENAAIFLFSDYSAEHKE